MDRRSEGCRDSSEECRLGLKPCVSAENLVLLPKPSAERGRRACAWGIEAIVQSDRFIAHKDTPIDGDGSVDPNDGILRVEACVPLD